jgi:hypothetical protein
MDKLKYGKQNKSIRKVNAVVQRLSSQKDMLVDAADIIIKFGLP